jgi:cell division protein FtsB
MKILIGVLIALLLGLQYKVWVGDGSLSEVVQLSKELERQKEKLHLLEQRNSVLEAQVLDLQNGLDAFEEKARNDLGMIKQGETFIQLIPGPDDLSNEPVK